MTSTNMMHLWLIISLAMERMLIYGTGGDLASFFVSVVGRRKRGWQDRGGGGEEAFAGSSDLPSLMWNGAPYVEAKAPP
jgi:hypothetical protein